MFVLCVRLCWSFVRKLHKAEKWHSNKGARWRLELEERLVSF